MYGSLKSGLTKIKPHRKDFSLVHSFGLVSFDTNGLPENFSVYDGRPIPNQNDFDNRFNPPISPLPYGCTGESQTFSCGLQDGKLFNPKFTYDNTPPGGDGGRDLRDAIKCTINRGLQDETSAVGWNRTAFFNCYGSGKIDDFDAARIAVWINQDEKRSVTVGSYWYPEFENIGSSGILPIPSFDTSTATLHNWIVTGWKKINGKEYLEAISWQGMEYGDRGLCYVPRELYNALMAQPWTGAFTVTKDKGDAVPIGMTAIIDHLVYFIVNLFNAR